MVGSGAATCPTPGLDEVLSQRRTAKTPEIRSASSVCLISGDPN